MPAASLIARFGLENGQRYMSGRATKKQLAAYIVFFLSSHATTPATTATTTTMPIRNTIRGVMIFSLDE
jgi:hypothetical protein